MAVGRRKTATPESLQEKEPASPLNVDTNLIETLAELLQRTGLTEIELSEGEARIRVVRAPAPVMAMAPTAGTVIAPQSTPPAESATAQNAREEANHPGGVRAPMVGTVYLTPEPGAEPFVTVGSEVKEGETLLIVEAMKVMNPIRASRSGRIAKILVTNGDPVEFGELLLIID